MNPQGYTHFAIMPYNLRGVEHYSCSQMPTWAQAIMHIINAAMREPEVLRRGDQHWIPGAYQHARIISLAPGEEKSLQCPCGDTILLTNRFFKP